MKIFKTALTSGVAAAAFLLACSSSALATTIIISGDNDYRSGLGGEFNVRAGDAGGATLLSTLSSGYTTVDGIVVGTADGTRMNAGFGGAVGFQTFCVEYNEHIALGGVYDAAISDGAIAGGVGGGSDPDGAGPLPSTDLVSKGTAYLYSQFATGSLAGYTYADGAARAASAVKLQEAIWYLEDEVSLNASQVAANSFLQLAFAAFGADVKADSGGLFGVRVLNLGTAGGPNQNQDQLIMVGVPDGGQTALLFGLGLGGLALMRRRLA